MCIRDRSAAMADELLSVNQLPTVYSVEDAYERSYEYYTVCVDRSVFSYTIHQPKSAGKMAKGPRIWLALPSICVRLLTKLLKKRRPAHF